MKLKFGLVRDEQMNMTLTYDNKSYQIEHTNPMVSIPIMLPANIRIDFFGKDPNLDTIVKDNKIVEDKYIQITKITLDDIPFDGKYLHQCLTINTNAGDNITTSYIGFNGVMNINLNKDTVFEQITEAFTG